MRKQSSQIFYTPFPTPMEQATTSEYGNSYMTVRSSPPWICKDQYLLRVKLTHCIALLDITHDASHIQNARTNEQPVHHQPNELDKFIILYLHCSTNCFHKQILLLHLESTR